VTITRHTISALMQVDPAYWANVSDVPVWADSVQGEVQWAPYDSSITVTKVTNAAGRYELRLDWNRASGTQQITHQVTTVAGKSYRVVASMYALMPKMTGYTIGSPSTSVGASPDRDLTATPYEVWGVFTASSTSTFLAIKSPSPWAVNPPATGTVYVTAVSLYEVVSTTYVDLHPVQATVRLDTEWSPYVRVDLTCPLPAADALSKIDPRGVDSSGTLKAVPARAVINLSAAGGDTLSAADLTAQLKATGVSTAAGLTAAWAGKTAAYLTTRFAAPYNGSVATRTNLITNPSFETNRTYWSATSAAVSRLTTGGQEGPAHLRCTATASNTTFVASCESQTLTPGEGFHLSAWVKGVPGRTMNLRMHWLSDLSVTVGPTITLTAAWQRVVFVGTVPANSPYGFAEIAQLAAGTVVGDTLDIDGVMLLRGTSSPTETYFDGSTLDTFTHDFAWTGVAHGSSSTATPIPDPGLTSSRRLDVHLRSREVDYVAGTMRLELTSDEMYLQDFARYDTSTSTWTPPATSSLRVLVNWALGLFGWALQSTGTDATIDAAKVIWNLGETLWSFLDAYIRGSGKRLWCDESRKWYLTDSIPTAAGVATIAALTTCTDTLSRSDEAYGDAAVMEYTWTDAAGMAHRDYAYAYTPGLVTPRTVVQRFTDQQPAPGAVGVGVARLRTRAMSRGRNIRARAVSSYAVTPGQQALITTPVTTITGALVSAVTWTLPEDEMDVTTRDVVA
jgi:hypothetical protein